MKKLAIAIAAALAAFGAQAHYSNRVHYHMDDGRVMYSNSIPDDVKVTFEGTGAERDRVTTTVHCDRTRVNFRNNHLRCVRTSTSVTRADAPVLVVAPVVQRRVEVDSNGRRVIVTTTYTCTRPVARRDGSVACLRWTSSTTREVVRNRRSVDLNGDGKSEAWERVLFNQFRRILAD